MSSVPTPATASEGDTIDVSKLLGTLWRAKVMITAVGLLFMLVFGYYAYVMATPIYSATSSVMLESREEQIVDLQSVIGGLSADTAAINTELEVLTSTALYSKVVDALDLVQDPEFNGSLRPPSALSALSQSVKTVVLGLWDSDSGDENDEMMEADQQRRTYEAVVANLGEHVSVRNVPQSLVFEVTARSEDQKKASLISDTLVELYIRDQLEVKFEALQQATSWLSDRVSGLRVELENSTNELNDFRAGSDMISPEVLASLELQLKELRDRLENLLQEKSDVEARLAAFEVAQTRAEIAEALGDTQLMQLLPRVDQTAIADTFDRRAEQLVQRDRQNLVRIANQQDTVQRAQSDLEQKIAAQTQDLIQIQQFERELDSNRLLYETFLNRLKETSVQAGIQQADARVLSSARLPVNASAPKKNQLLVGGLLLGLLIGAAIALFREMSSNTYRLSSEIEEATGYRVFGVLPLIPGRARKDKIDYLREKSVSASAEAMRNLRTSVLLADIGGKIPQLIMSTSALPGEGKTTVSIGLAQNFALMGKKVLLIEGDMRRRVISDYSNEAHESTLKRGIFNALEEGLNPLDLVVTDEEMGLDIMFAGTPTANPADIMESKRFRELLTHLRQIYDHIIIDTPPVLIVPDARVVAANADTVILVVRWDDTARGQVRAALRELESVNRPADGIVLNQVNPKGLKRYGYGDQYGAHYSYGEGYYTKQS